MDEIHATEDELRLELRVAHEEAIAAELRVRDVERKLAQATSRRVRLTTAA